MKCAPNWRDYTYDGDGQRLTKTVGSETITYHYFGGQLMYETSNQYADKVTARYTRTPEGKLLSIYIYRPVGDYYNYYYYHYNAHGDVAAVTDTNGAVYRQYAYDPYGNVISVKDGAGVSKDMSTDEFNHAYTYAGYRYDKETGLYFLNARYYNAGIGRLLTKDNVGISTSPQTLNRYLYAGGDPINRIDPSGNIWNFLAAIATTAFIALVNYANVLFSSPDFNTDVQIVISDFNNGDPDRYVSVAAAGIPGLSAGSAKASTKAVKGAISSKAIKKINKHFKENAELVAKQFSNSLNNGFVRRKGEEGIIKIKRAGHKIGNTIYSYELKILGRGVGDYRLYGNIDDNGELLFDAFGKALHK